MRGVSLDLEGAAGLGRLNVVRRFFNANGELVSTATSASNVRPQGSLYATRRTAPVNVTATIGELPEVWYRYGDSNPGPVAEKPVLRQAPKIAAQLPSPRLGRSARRLSALPLGSRSTWWDL
jgi:hypothetical protein